ncbi:MAG: GGDEF domain-containing protein [Candidatus Aureabacteria bacterium]|nr:GGDEF domain-containing protein [Candidatus Auribacterota bacterium]
MTEIILTGFFLLIAALGLFTTVRAAFITTLFSLAAFFVMAFLKIHSFAESYSWGITTFSLIIFYLIVFYLLIAKVKNHYEKYLFEMNTMILNFDTRITQVSRSNHDIKRNNQELKKKAGELSLIYNSIKNMSSTLDFFETLKSFSSDLNEMTGFHKGRLILINLDNYDKNVFQIESVYKFNSTAMNLPVYEVADKTPFDFTVAELVLKSKKEKMMESNIIFEKESELKMSHPVFTEMKAVLPVCLFPLEVKNEILGILITEGIEKDNYQKVNIIINHFAMEIKKIRLYEKLKSLSLIDGLTGLYLRRHFIKRLEEEMERVTRNKGVLSLMMFDIDDFKNFNDKYGHLAGDIILKETSNIIKSNSREIDLIGRYGGDEIIMALPMTDSEKAREISERIRKMVEQHRFNTSYDLIHATVSIGIAFFPNKEIETSLDLITAADSALYAAKRKGKNTIVVK